MIKEMPAKMMEALFNFKYLSVGNAYSIVTSLTNCQYCQNYVYAPK